MNELIEADPERVERMLAVQEMEFSHNEKMGMVMISANSWPAHLKTVGDYFVVIDLADTFKTKPLAIANEVYLVKGKFGFSAKFCVMEFNKSPEWERMDWEESGQGSQTKFRAYSKSIERNDAGEKDKDSKIFYGPWVDRKYAELQGWMKNAQWVTNFDQMARYRSATMFIKLYANEVLHGGNVADDMEEHTTDRKRVPRNTLDSSSDDIATDLNSISSKDQDAIDVEIQVVKDEK